MRAAVILLAMASARGAENLVTLRNGEIEATFAPEHGADLCSLKVKHRGEWVETLYRACDYAPSQGWTGKAPWLWPATGRSFPKDVRPNEEARGSSYDYKGHRYPMPIHGFVRDLPWKVESARPDQALFSLESTGDTRRMYPFGWRLELDARVVNASLKVEFRAIAAKSNAEPMMFSAGNHITFVAPLVRGSGAGSMRFATPSRTEYLKAAGGVPTGDSRTRELSAGMPLQDYEALQAVSLGGYGREASMTLADPAGLTVRITHTASQVPPEPVLRFNVWGDPKNGYFSPEPWVGQQNSLNTGKALVKLAPGQRWTWKLTVDFPQR